MDIKNFTDPFRVVHGVGQSINLIRKLKPNMIFSKGGFVSVPVVLGGWANRVPIIIHESDITPGLANKISFPFASQGMYCLPRNHRVFKGDKGVYTGIPLRKELLTGDAEMGRRICGFTDKKPVIMVMGGSLGAVAINKLIRNILGRLISRFNVVHLCGKNNLDTSLMDVPQYKQFEYVAKNFLI